MDNSLEDFRTNRSDLTDILSDLANDLAVRERRLRGELPTDSIHGIDECIADAREQWESGTRSMRSYPAVTAFEHVLGLQLDERVRSLLVALDAKVMAFDDIIDTENLTKEEKVNSSVLVAFSTPLELESTPSEYREEILEIQNEYWVVLSQLPFVEQQMMEAIRLSESRDDRLEAAHSVYAYRGRDIDAFARIVATVYEVGAATADLLLTDLRSFRAKYLLYEDFRHIKRDLKEGHYNPVIVLMYALDDPDEVIATIEALYDRFDYTEAGAERYGDLFRGMERRPDDLDRLVRESMRVLSGSIS